MNDRFDWIHEARPRRRMLASRAVDVALDALVLSVVGTCRLAQIIARLPFRALARIVIALRSRSYYSAKSY